MSNKDAVHGDKIAQAIGVWFPVIKAVTGVDWFTERLIKALRKRGVRAEASWLPLKAEYAPWLVKSPEVPDWATVVHVNASLPAKFIPVDIPCVATFHSFAHDSTLTKYKSLPQFLYHELWVKHCEQKVVQRAERLTAVSEYASKVNHQLFRHQLPKRIYNWIDTDEFVPKPYVPPQEPFKLLYVGKISRMKGSDLLASIMEQLGAGFELSYTGESSELIALGSFTTQTMIPLGKIETAGELIEKYQNADALLFPTRTEGFGLVALEAQACGLPVVATNCTSLPEVVKDGKTGFLCEMDQVCDFVKAIKKLSDKTLHREMSFSARSRAEKKFSEEVAVRDYLDTYAAL